MIGCIGHSQCSRWRLTPQRYPVLLALLGPVTVSAPQRSCQSRCALWLQAVPVTSDPTDISHGDVLCGLCQTCERA
eukprot:2462819-Rhodomonas_salina.1